MGAFDHTLANADHREDLWGPDLAKLPSLAMQLAVLDEAAACDDVEEYVERWLTVCDINGGTPMAEWGNDDPADAPARLMAGVTCDSQERERRERRDALTEHHQTVEGFHAALERELVRRGRYMDNRKTSLREISTVVRAFLATGGRLMIAPPSVKTARRTVEASPDTKLFVRGRWPDTHEVAATAMFRLLRRWRARPAIERIVRSLGQRTPHDWIVLEGDRS